MHGGSEIDDGRSASADDEATRLGRAAWDQIATAREADLPKLGQLQYPISGLVRRARRIARVSVRELAKRAGVSTSTVGRVESGAITPTLPAFERMLAVAGLWLVVVDDDGHVVTPMRDIPDIHHGGGWRYPSHLDVILDPKPGEWWADGYGLTRPPETFHRDHERRAALQARSQWEVRAKLNRGVPPPPDPFDDERARAWRAEHPPRPVPPMNAADVDVDEFTDADADAWRPPDPGDAA